MESIPTTPCHTEHHTPDKVPAVKHTARETILNDKNRSVQSHPSDKGADGVKDRRETPQPSPTLRHWRQLGLSISTVGPQPCLGSRVTETSLNHRLHSNVQQSVGGRKRGVQCAARLSAHPVLTPWMGPCPPPPPLKIKKAQEMDQWGTVALLWAMNRWGVDTYYIQGCTCHIIHTDTGFSVI